MAGITGRLYQQFALTIAVSVLISAFNALTLSPALAALLLAPAARPPRACFGRLGRGFNRVVRAGHQRLRRASNARLIRKLAIPLVLLAGGRRRCRAASGASCPSGFLPDEDNGYALIGVQLPDAASLQRTKAVFKKVEAILGQHRGRPDLQHHRRLQLLHPLGRQLRGHGVHRLQAVGRARSPRPDRQGDRRQAERRSSRKIPEARVFALLPPAIPGISAAGGFSMFLQDRSGGTSKFLAENVKRFVDAARKRPELQNVHPQLLARRAADLRRGRQGEGVEAGGAHRATSTRRCRRSWAAPTSTTSPASRGSGGCSSQAEPAYRREPRRT